MSTVQNDRAASRFVLEVDGATAFAIYRHEGDRIIFTHTEVPEALAGQGIGGRLIRSALDASREDGLTVVPECSFVRHFMDTHPDYRDLV